MAKRILVKEYFCKTLVYETQDSAIIAKATTEMGKPKGFPGSVTPAQKSVVFGDLNPKTAFSDHDVMYQYQGSEVLAVEDLPIEFIS